MSINVFSGFDYSPNEIDTEIFLSELPLSIMLVNITEQFKDPMDNRKNDLVQSFLNKYAYTKENMTEDDEDEVSEFHTSFISHMENLFKEFLDIGFPELDNLEDELQEELIHYTYRYFIINIKKNFVNLIFNYMEDHKEKLCNEIEKKKDVTSLSLKKNVTDENDLTILANLSEVIEDILETDFTIDEFFNYSRTDDSNLEMEYISDKYDEFDITGNFVKGYVHMIDEDFETEIECKVRNKILKKYKKK